MSRGFEPVVDRGEETLKIVEQQLGKRYPLIISGEEIFTEEVIISSNPSCPRQVVGYVAKASLELAKFALGSAEKTFATWSRVMPQRRANYLFKAATIMRDKKKELSSWLVYETGKNLSEAGADIAKAIEYLDFYAHEMCRLVKPKTLAYIPIPLGVGIIIPPWNFTLASMAGMVAAAVVVGNTVVLKTGSNTPVIASKFMEILKDVGIPDGVVNYLPGSEGTIGDYLVNSPKTKFIRISESKEFGF